MLFVIELSFFLLDYVWQRIICNCVLVAHGHGITFFLFFFLLSSLKSSGQGTISVLAATRCSMPYRKGLSTPRAHSIVENGRCDKGTRVRGVAFVFLVTSSLFSVIRRRRIYHSSFTVFIVQPCASEHILSIMISYRQEIRRVTRVKPDVSSGKRGASPRKGGGAVVIRFSSHGRALAGPGPRNAQTYFHGVWKKELRWPIGKRFGIRNGRRPNATQTRGIGIQ